MNIRKTRMGESDLEMEADSNLFRKYSELKEQVQKIFRVLDIKENNHYLEREGHDLDEVNPQKDFSSLEKKIQTLEKEFDCIVGYSGHEVGLQTTYAAVVLGASFVERHITLDRAMWGTDQAASVEPWGLMRLVRDIRVIGSALGDGIKKVYDSEKIARARLRGN